MKKGFTLIELLVVVLIIAILSAVAIPQYNKAVVKNKIISSMPLIDSLKKSSELYFLEHGQYPDQDMSELDILLPSSCHIEYRADGVDIQCGEYNYITVGTYHHNAGGLISLSYCPKHNKNYFTCQPYRELVITFYLSHPNRNDQNAQWRVPNTSLCEPQTTFGRQICRALLGTVVDRVYGD